MRHFVKVTLLTGAFAAAGLAWDRQAVVHSQSIGAPRNVPGIDRPVRIIRGRFTQNVTLTRDTYWVLRGAVFIAEPARLTIESGTTIIGETATRGTLVIERGAQILANGTAAQPIVMTSDQRVGQRGRGDWGGLVINGRAPINQGQGEAIGEGSTGIYGGSDINDNSGILRFVRVEFAGIEFSPDNELNGIAFQGVGRGTIVENIQVHFNKDDGIEMFGGMVDVKRVVLTGIGDDNIDWTWGWRGRLQFAVCLQRGDDTDQGIEADNHSVTQSIEPRSEPTLFNLTLVGDRLTDFGPESTNGARIRVGTGGHIRNFIFTNFKQQGIDVRDNATTANIATGRLSLGNGILFNNGSGGTVNWATNATTVAVRTAFGATIAEVNPMLVAPTHRTAPDWRPLPGSPALTNTPAVPPNDGFFEPAPFIGALGPDLATDWTKGWTTFAQN
jgi:hypothetical protein